MQIAELKYCSENEIVCRVGAEKIFRAQIKNRVVPVRKFIREVKLKICISESGKENFMRSKSRTRFKDKQRKQEKYQNLEKMSKADFSYENSSVWVVVLVYDSLHYC